MDEKEGLRMEGNWNQSGGIKQKKWMGGIKEIVGFRMQKCIFLKRMN
jgi:hypothetical protein